MRFLPGLLPWEKVGVPSDSSQAARQAGHRIWRCRRLAMGIARHEADRSEASTAAPILCQRAPSTLLIASTSWNKTYSLTADFSASEITVQRTMPSHGSIANS